MSGICNTCLCLMFHPIIFNYCLNRHCLFKTHISLFKAFFVPSKIFIPLSPSILIQFIFTGQIKYFAYNETFFEPLDRDELKFSGKSEKEKK